MEDASVILASAAFIVAVVSLYVGNLRRADIEITPTPGRPIRLGMHQKRRDEGPPVRADVDVPVAIVNRGARPGVVTGLDVVRGSGPFHVIEGCFPNPNWRDGVLGALPLLSGESQVMIVTLTMTFPEESVEAWRDGRFRSFDVVITYSFLRGRRIRPTASRKLKVDVPVDAIASTP